MQCELCQSSEHTDGCRATEMGARNGQRKERQVRPREQHGQRLKISGHLEQGSANMSVKDHMVTILGFMDDIVSVQLLNSAFAVQKQPQMYTDGHGLCQ